MRLVLCSLSLFLCMFALPACKSSGMTKSANATVMAPAADSAVIIFMRPSNLGGGVQSVVYDTTTQENTLVGIVSSGTKVAYRVAPGEHLFMVVGEAADFMKATLEANKTYYALVTPRMGAWRARFSLKPVRSDELDGRSFKGWDRTCALYENNEGAIRWASENEPSVRKRREEYYAKWITKSPEQLDEVTLRPSDGR